MAEARLIDGAAVASRVRERVRGEVAAFSSEHGRAPALATVLVGEDPASRIYVGRKHEACAAAGIGSVNRELPADVAQPALMELVDGLNSDDAIDGILVQLPLPPGLDSGETIGALDPAKDVDGLTAHSAGLLAQGRPALLPCTPAGVMELLRSEEIALEGAEAVVLGRSQLVGRPLAALLTAASATVTVCHSRTRDLATVCSRADILVAAVGSPRMVGAGMVKPGAVVIDVGINRLPAGGMVGDVDFDAVRLVAAAITPVPGGVGPMTIAMLLANTLEAARGRVTGAGVEALPGRLRR